VRIVLRKQGSTVKKYLVVKSIVSKEINFRCQIDLIGIQAQLYGNYKFSLPRPFKKIYKLIPFDS
jgi:hypothetical protein